MKLEIKHFVQLSPVFIASFMLMSSMFNGDVKAFIWLFFQMRKTQEPALFCIKLPTSQGYKTSA
jgi:hypothetical protein